MGICAQEKNHNWYLGNYFYTLALVRYNILSGDIAIYLKIHAEKYEEIQCYARTRRFIAENNTVQLRLWLMRLWIKKTPCVGLRGHWCLREWWSSCVWRQWLIGIRLVSEANKTPLKGTKSLLYIVRLHVILHLVVIQAECL